MTVASIDPGLHGGVAFIGNFVDAFKMPLVSGEIDTEDIANQLNVWSPSVVVLEQTISMPNQSSQSTMTTGKNWGRIYERLRVGGFSIEIVQPRAWASKIGAPQGLKGKELKAWRIVKAKELFPTVTLKASDDGMADALLMAWVRSKGLI